MRDRETWTEGQLRKGCGWDCGLLFAGMEKGRRKARVERKMDEDVVFMAGRGGRHGWGGGTEGQQQSGKIHRATDTGMDVFLRYVLCVLPAIGIQPGDSLKRKMTQWHSTRQDGQLQSSMTLCPVRDLGRRELWYRNIQPKPTVLERRAMT